MTGADPTRTDAARPVPTVRDLAVVVPCYDEEAVLAETASRLLAVLQSLARAGKIGPASGIWFVDDGSRDTTWTIIESLAATDRCIHGIKLSRNRGHQQALLAGLTHASGDIVVTVDADLQDDVAAIEEMVDANSRGADIVYGVRRRRDQDTFFKRFSAETYYHLLRMMGVEIVFNHADYRLMSRRAIDALGEFKEVNLFLRGVIPQLGFRTAEVAYDRAERFAGESKYPLRKMLAFAIHGVTSFSSVPLRWITVIGFLISVSAFGFGAWALYATLIGRATVSGWASTVIPIYFLGGIQLLSIGVIGEYLAKIYLETKARPRFVIEQTI